MANADAAMPTTTGQLNDNDVAKSAYRFQAASGSGDNSYGTYSVDGPCSWSYTLDNSNAAVQALNDGGSTTDTFTVLTADGTELVVTITITGTNDAAVVSGYISGSMVEAGGVANADAGTPTAAVTLTDPDVDN